MSVDDEYAITPTEEHLPLSYLRKTNGDPFGDFIRRRRFELGITLRELEERTGLDNSRLSRWEHGAKRPVSPDLMPQLADGLEVPVSDLYRLVAPGMADSLPELRPYLHTKYGELVPEEVLAEVADHCEKVLAGHGVQSAQLVYKSALRRRRRTELVGEPK